MANRTGDDRRSPSKLPIRLVGAVLVLGALLAWWGTRDQRRLFGEALREPVAAIGVALPKQTEEDSALVGRGSEISTRQCAGCHEMTTRTNAPSYQEIVNFYRREVPISAGGPDLRSRLASAVTHPRPGWGNFAPGPLESDLSLTDRIALATWMLNRFDRDKHAK